MTGTAADALAVTRVLDAADRIVVVSPHFDDAVLSAGGLIAARVEARQPVEVLTVFSSARAIATRGGRHQAFTDYALRVAEDDRALAALGARARRLGLYERLFRDPPPRGPFGLFRTSLEIARSAETSAVQRAIAEALNNGNAIILAPLGIGNHVDHVIVTVGALRAIRDRDAQARVLFFEDFNAMSERNRRLHPVSRLRPFPFRDAPGWASPRTAVEMTAISLLTRGPDPTALCDLPVRAEEWSMSALPLTTRHETAKFEALAEYRTQTSALGGEPQLRALLERAHARRGGELLWRFRASGASSS
ncbi:PIG-L family deacetylase [Nocardia sp. NBC_01388]|uniref:PIG-L family deacetylase n=1 Tax=Nocardia sp. NBC_01388 TaxID=2903596 RepID=UPI0032456CC2